MGLYVNPNNVLFTRYLNSRIYVDKSMIIEQLNNLIDASAKKYICVSHPRRFGKTMAAALISAFYSKGCDSRSLFSNLQIAQTPNWDKNLNKFNVIILDVQGILCSTEPESLVSKINNKVNKELIEIFPNSKIKLHDYLDKSLLKVYNTTGEQFIIIMDEYDVLVREQVSDKALKKYLDFLNRLFTNNTLKPAISLAYLTGILPIVRGKGESLLNEFNEESMTEASCLRNFIGFTEKEVESLCQQHNMDFNECKKWYKGYKIENNNAIYNPVTIVRAMTTNRYYYHWNRTGSYMNIKDSITLKFDGIKEDVITMLNGGQVHVNVSKFLNTYSDFYSKDDVFAYLIHLGYLDYNEEEKVCRIPNYEIRQEWINAISIIPEYSDVMKMLKES